MSERIRNTVREKEIDEAIDAGNRALNALRNAQSCLNSASAWGLYDLVGGGMFTSMVKHSKLKKAERYLEEAHHHRNLFYRELKDAHRVEPRVNADGFLKVTDIFTDNGFSDFIVQSRIQKARRATAEEIRRVEEQLVTLHRLRF